MRIGKCRSHPDIGGVPSFLSTGFRSRVSRLQHSIEHTNEECNDAGCYGCQWQRGVARLMDKLAIAHAEILCGYRLRLRTGILWGVSWIYSALHEFGRTQAPVALVVVMLFTAFFQIPRPSNLEDADVQFTACRKKGGLSIRCPSATTSRAGSTSFSPTRHRDRRPMRLTSIVS